MKSALIALLVVALISTAFAQTRGEQPSVIHRRVGSASCHPASHARLGAIVPEQAPYPVSGFTISGFFVDQYDRYSVGIRWSWMFYAGWYDQCGDRHVTYLEYGCPFGDPCGARQQLADGWRPEIWEAGWVSGLEAPASR